MWNFPIIPEQASNFAPEYDALFFVLTGLTAVFTIIVYAMVLFFVIRYRRGKKVNRKNAPDHSTVLELTWTIIPTILGLGMFYLTARQFNEMRHPPADAMEVFVVGKQWMWHLQHANGVRENNELHVPLGQPVKLTMISQDVLHSFYLPAFRVKQDVLPGRYTQLWFTPTKVGKFNLWCAEYCGMQHSEMGGYVYVMEPHEFQRWLANGGNQLEPVALTMEEQGKKLYESLGCARGSCHGSADSSGAPSLYGVFGAKRKLEDGQIVVADEAYMRESIIHPYNQVVAGYERTMPDYSQSLTELQTLQLISYIKTLGSAPATAPLNSVLTPAAPSNSKAATSVIPVKPAATGEAPR